MLEEGVVAEEVDEEEEFTKPIELSKREPAAGATVEDMLKVWARIDRFKSESRARRRSEANQMLEIQAQPKLDTERVKTLEWKMRIIWGLLIAALSLAGGSVFSISKYLYTFGGDSREATINMKNLIDRSLDNQRRVQELEQKLLLLINKKDTTP